MSTVTTTHEHNVGLDAETRLRDHPDLVATAFHESGHAVAALRSGLALRGVDVVYTITRFGAADFDHEHAPLETRALCLLAAGAAERRYTGSHRAHDAGDVDALRDLFKGSALDPDQPYAQRHPGADAERQRIVDEWYKKASDFVDREWMWIERVARELQRRERLTGAEVKTLCSHPVVHLDPPSPMDEDAGAGLTTLTVGPDPAPVTTIADTAPDGNGMYDTKLFQAAHRRFLTDVKTLTDADLAQLGVVDPNLAERARAARAGFIEAETEAEKKVGRRPLRTKVFMQFLSDYFGPILATHRYKSQQAHSRLDVLEQRLAALEGDRLEPRVKALESRPSLKHCGPWVEGQSYSEGNLVTRKGGMWLAIRAQPETPGAPDSGWQLVVKEGLAR